MQVRQLLKLRCLHELSCKRSFSSRQLSNAEVHRKRSQLFGEEKARQRALISRVEKIQVEHKGTPEECTLLMNKGLSTPFNCAMHIHELLMQRSVVAVVNGVPWDMHRPLEEDCEIQFLHFKDEDPSLSNQVFWRSCSFILGHILETAFRDQYYVELCSFPRPDVASGSFIYDVDLKVPDWRPSSVELSTMSRIGLKLNKDAVKFERLEVDASIAEKIFEDNRFKCEQVPSIAAQGRHGNTVTLYRLGDHVDISRGPLMSNTSLLARFSVCAVHDIDSPNHGKLQRVQGVAVPSQLKLHYWAYEILCKRAAILNKAPIPGAVHNREEHTFLQEEQQNS